ncbi:MULTISPECIES: helix-turn-helix domain-containing protein [Rhizobium]|nr:helix-turn-helix transcriptional regulator [Rhizobium laguerreae]
MRDPLYTAVGEAIRRKREARALSQAALAKRVNLSRTSITNIESGTQALPLHNFLAIAEALSAEPAELLPNTREETRRPVKSSNSPWFEELLGKLGSEPGRDSQ